MIQQRCELTLEIVSRQGVVWVVNTEKLKGVLLLLTLVKWRNYKAT